MRYATIPILLLCATALASCNSSDDALQGSVSEKPAIVDQPLTTGAPEIERINKAGGTKIAVLVNNTAITSNDIKRRAAFVRLRRLKGNSTQIAREELVKEALQMQEARRINTVASDDEVNAAYGRFAKSNKMPTNVLSQVLERRGVTQRGFKEYIRAQISWQRALSARIGAEGRRSTNQSRQQSWLPDAKDQDKREKAYTLQQIVFIVPPKKRGARLSARKSEANQFRTRFNGCENTKALATQLTDVAVKDLGRIRAHRLPPRWKKDIESAPQGGTTKPKETEKGIEILAVCQSREVQSTAPEAAELFSGDNVQKAASELETKYMGELRKRAVIKNRG